MNVIEQQLGHANLSVSSRYLDHIAPQEHHDIRWCSAAELDDLQPPMAAAVKWYCRKAIEEVDG